MSSANRLTNSSGSLIASTTVDDKYFDRFRNLVKKNDGIAIVVGRIIRASIGSYDFEVEVDNKRSVVCTLMEDACSISSGYSVSTIPHEGQLVVVLLSRLTASSGTILGVLPWTKDTAEKSGDADTIFFKSMNPEYDCGYDSIMAYKKINDDSEYGNKKWAGARRANDVFPGDYAVLNENGCGIYFDMFTATLLGGGASISASVLDNELQLASLSMKVDDIMLHDHTFDDEGHVSREISYATGYGERLGVKPKAIPFKTSEESYPLESKKPAQTMKSRIREFIGFLAGIYSKFILRPDPDIDCLTKEDSPKDRGVDYENIDESGRHFHRTAGGISIERFDRIPVPFRKKEFSDPEGDKEVSYKSLEEFQWNENPHYRSIELVDSLAWDYRNAYARFDEHKKDFYTPEQADLKTPEDVYDPGDTDSKKVKLSKNEKRRSGIFLGEDGSIIIRDAWGSEIVMEGGNITISAAGNINVLPAKTAVVMAGDDAVIRSYNSIDINANKKDVRIKANNNMQLVSGSSDGSGSGGILMESLSQSKSVWDATTNQGGEALKTAGIVLKADNSAIVENAESLYSISKKNSFIKCGEENDGELFICTGKTTLSAEEKASIITETSAFIVEKEKASIVAKDSISLVTKEDKKISALSGGFAGSFLFTETDEDPGDVIDTVKDVSETLTSSVITQPYTFEALKKMKFKYRNSQECGTDSGSEVFKPSPSFTMIQPHWAVMKTMNSSLISGSQSTWDETPINGEYTWPGKDAWTSSGKYAYIKKPENIDGFYEKERKSITNKSNVQTKKLDSGYEILKS